MTCSVNREARSFSCWWRIRRSLHISVTNTMPDQSEARHVPAGTPDWLRWARRVQALAQNGLTSCTDPSISSDMARCGMWPWKSSPLTRPCPSRPSVICSPAGRDMPRRRSMSAGPCSAKTARSCSCANGRTAVGPFPADGSTSASRHRKPWPRKCVKSPATSSRAAKVLAVFDRDRHGHPPSAHHVYKLFLRCEILGGDRAAPGVEIDAVGFFAPRQIPPLSLTRVTPEQIARLFAHYEHPEWPTDFDCDPLLTSVVTDLMWGRASALPNRCALAGLKACPT